MSEIETLSLERLNNGAHFLFISNVLARADDATVKGKLSAQIASLKAAKEKEDEDLKICLRIDIKNGEKEIHYITRRFYVRS